MPKQSQFSLIATSILLVSSMLAGCSSSNSGGGASNVTAEPPKVASVSAAAAPPSPATPAPVAFTPEPAVGVITTCNIEEFDKSSFQSAPTEATLSAMHSVSGWIAAPQLTTPSFWLRLDDKAQNQYFQVPVALSVKRPDVASSADGSSIPLVSGFVLNLPVHAVPAGQYHLYLAAHADGKTSICDSGRQADFK